MFKRLITRQLHRAFPELDRFDDERARAFVAAAGQSWRRAIVRWCLALLVLGTTSLLLIWIAQAIAGRFVPWPVTWIMDRLLVAAPILIVTFAISFTLAMRTRDWALQRSIRRLINLRGTCASCGYSLLGMPVPADLRLTCPECGKVTLADASMNELSVTPGGQRVYEPDFAVLTGEHLAASRRRRRRALKFAGIATAIVIGVPLLSYLGLRGFLSWQAARARADLARLNAEVRAEEASRPGSASSVQEWLDLAAKHDKLGTEARDDFETQRVRDALPLVVPTVFQSQWAWGNIDDALLAPHPWSAVAEADEIVFDRFILLCKDRGWDAALDALLARPINFASVLPDADQSRRAAGSPHGELYTVSKSLSVRTALSLRRGDVQSFAIDLRRQIALARMLDEAMYQQQGHVLPPTYFMTDELGMIERFVKYAASQPKGGAFLAAIQHELQTAARPVPAFDTEKVAARVRSGYERLIAWHFSNAGRVEGLLLGFGETDSLAGLNSFSGESIRFWLGRHGTYAENKEAARVASERIAMQIASARNPGSQAGASVPVVLRPTGKLLFEQMLIWGESAAQSSEDDRYAAHLRALHIWTAIERHHQRTGRLPAQLTDLSAEDGIESADDLLDPLTAKPIVYERGAKPRNLRNNHWGYLLTFGSGQNPRDAWSHSGPVIGPFIITP